MQARPLRFVLGLLLGVGVMVALRFADCERTPRAEPEPSSPEAREPAVAPAPDAARTARETPPSAVAPQVAEDSAEQALASRARAALATEPERALELVQEADARFGERSEERRQLEIEALVALQRIGASHAKAAAFYRAFPASPRALEVERLTGYHPRPPGHE